MMANDATRDYWAIAAYVMTAVTVVMFFVIIAMSSAVKTSAEIIDYLQESNDKEAIEDLRQLFQTADLVKFAKYAPLLNENDMNLVSAVEFINQTKVEPDPNEKSAPTEITIEEKRSRRTKMLLLGGIVVLAILVVVGTYLVGADLYNLFF